jgi:hypothetical protein
MIQTENAIGGKQLGQHIAVLDRGFVYVGEIEEYPDRLHIKNARNIRKWGTTDGLGELRNGPLTTTQLDTVGEVVVFKHAVLHLIPCKGF